MAESHTDEIPEPGHWPVDPQEDQPISKQRIWVDGCFDFSHHGHAAAILQARRLGNELWIGIHSDEDILENKGPTVMNLRERCTAANACRWTTRSVPYAPYLTLLPYISHYGCWYVAHGDDITTDANGLDCYRFVKEADRYLEFKRTPGISTTDLVGRMLLCTKSHFIRSLTGTLAGNEGPGNAEERKHRGLEMKDRFKDYATDESGFKPWVQVWTWAASVEAKATPEDPQAGQFEILVDGVAPAQNQRLLYVDGGFDLFTPGHIEFLRQVYETEHSKAFIIVGVHDDEVINQWKGVNYPIMNIFERGLCVLQCRYVNAVIFGAPFTPSKQYLEALPMGTVSAVYHGPTAFMPLDHDPYVDAKKMGIFKEVPAHEFQNLNAHEIVMRIMKSREAFEERQRRKGQKGVGEDAIRRREVMEAEARAQEKRRLENHVMSNS